MRDLQYRYVPEDRIHRSLRDLLHRGTSSDRQKVFAGEILTRMGTWVPKCKNVHCKSYTNMACNLE